MYNKIPRFNKSEREYWVNRNVMNPLQKMVGNNTTTRLIKTLGPGKLGNKKWNKLYVYWYGNINKSGNVILIFDNNVDFGGFILGDKKIYLKDKNKKLILNKLVNKIERGDIKNTISMPVDYVKEYTKDVLKNYK